MTLARQMINPLNYNLISHQTLNKRGTHYGK